MEMKSSVKNMKIALVILAAAMTVAVLLVPATLPILGLAFVINCWVRTIKALRTK